MEPQKVSKEEKVPKSLALRQRWSPDGDTGPLLLNLAPGSSGTGRLDELIAGLRPGARCGEVAIQLCGKLRQGGNDAAEAAVELGGVEAGLALLEADREVPVATEALWLMLRDYESCQSFIKLGGHDKVIRLARGAASGDVKIAAGVFRLLSDTLYNEDRKAPLWQTADLDFVIEALAWALTSDLAERELPATAEGAGAGSILGFVCDVAALWIQRCSESGGEAVKALVALVPALLEKMAARTDDPRLLLHGSRLLMALARKCRGWPQDLREPAMAALKQMATMFEVPHPEVMAYTGLAFRALSEMLPQDAQTDLSSMD